MCRFPRLSSFVLALLITAGSASLLASPDSCPGTWRVLLPPGSGGSADLVSLPDGTLVAGLNTGGLRFYERGANGLYSWRSVTARAGSLASNKVTCLALFLGELWVGTQDAGISIQDLDTGAWRVVNTGNSVLASNWITHLTPVGPDPAIEKPRSTDSSLWASTTQGAAFYHYARVGQIQAWIWTLYNSADGLTDGYVRDIAVQFTGGERYTWFAVQETLSRWDGRTFTDFTLSCDMNTAERILVDDLNRVWFAGIQVIPGIGAGPGDGGGGTVLYAPSGLCRLTPSILRPTWTSFPDMYGHDMSLDASGRLWTSGVDVFGVQSGGAWVHDQGTWCVFKSPDHPINGNQVSAVQAMGELAWFAQRGTNILDGYTNNWSFIYKIRLNLASNVGPVAFHLGRAYVGGLKGFSYQPVIGQVPLSFVSLSQDAAAVTTALLFDGNDLWAGLDPDGLRRVAIDPADLSVDAIESFKAADGLAGDRVRAIAKDLGGRLWVGTRGGLSLRGNGYWLNFTTQTSPIAGNDLSSLAVDPQGKLWIGTRDGGISVLNPEALGGSAWSSQTTANGLASNDVRALAAGPDGRIWAATAGGACEWSPSSGQWRIHDAASGDLPGDSALSIAIDTGGRVWVGTEAGLAVSDNGAWRHFHPTSSTLESDLVTNVAANGDEIWASTDNQVAIRKPINGPIGELPPSITSFTPASAAPGDEVTITGQHFDSRGPAHNTVHVGTQEVLGGVSSKPAEVVSATATKIVFKVPELANDGKLRVMANCLEDESAATFKVGPKITSISPTCGGLGTEIKVFGAGFMAAGGVVVRVGNGPWRSPAATPGEHLSPDQIQFKLREGDQSGVIEARNNDGLVATSPQGVAIKELEVTGYKIVQGAQGLRNIWGKRTLVYLTLDVQSCGAKITGGKLLWKKKDGTLQLGGKAYLREWDQPLAFDINGSVSIDYDDFGGLEFVGEFESARSGWNGFFPLKDLASVVLTVQNNQVDALTHEIPASEFNFKEIKKRLDLLVIGVFPKSGGTSWDTFWSNATDSLLNVARIMPQPDFGPFYGTQSWMRISSSYFTRAQVDLRSDIFGADTFTDFAEVTGQAHDLLEPGFGQFGMALVDEALYVDHPDDIDPSGKAMLGPAYNGLTAVSFNFEGSAAPIIAQELCHMLGLVDGDAGNHDDENGGHSEYDEGEDYDDSDCALSSYLTYGEAVKDQRGIEYPLLRNVGSNAPIKLDWGSCSQNRAKSVMSYVPDAVNWNSLLEPYDQSAVVSYLVELYSRWQDGGGGGEGAGGEDGGGGGVAAGALLHLHSLITMSGAVQVTLSYVDAASIEPATFPEEGSHYHAMVRDAGGTQLVDLPFRVDFHGHIDVEPSTYFGIRVPWPSDARKVEIQKDDQVLFSKSQSPNPPVVAFTAPSGGTFSADSTVPLSWTASDPDGDRLQFALDYSPDGGATWIQLPQYLTDAAYDWTPNFLPRSDSARLRVRASDGFNTGEALSAPFKLTAAQPLVFLRSPADGASIPEGSTVDLVAGSMTSEGVDQGAFAWKVDGQPVPSDPNGNGSGSEFTFNTTGAHTILVTLTDPSGRKASKQVTVQVIPDYDQDGMPNDWEQAHGLNPLDATDATRDNDSDGLSNYSEYRRGTDPNVADTDGDGASDGAEILAGTNPLRADSTPPTSPVLIVGLSQPGFTVEEGQAASEPKSFFVVNGGPGTFTWSVENSLPWLEVTPGSGAPLAEVTLTAMPNGLGVGQYTGQIVFSAPGALQSPHVVTVTLTVKPRGPHVETRFIRGDSNGDGKLNISDASFTLTYLFVDSTRTPACIDAADSNDDGKVNITDPIYALGSLFLGGPAPPAPFPACGEDPSADALECASGAACP